MNNVYIASIARHLLGAAGGALVSKGYIDSTAVEPLAGALMTLGAFAWSFFEKKRR